jgi:transposase
VLAIRFPPYKPELNPCEQLWDIIKDEIGNRVFETVVELREAILPALQRYWDDAAAVLRLVVRSWLLDQVNASNKTAVSQ